MREYKDMSTSEVVETLQKAIEAHGDLPFVIRDSGNGIDYDRVRPFANTFANGGCDDEDWDEEQIGVAFMDEYDAMATSEVARRLQRAIDEHGDLPFVICDSDIAIEYSEISVFADTTENGGCSEDDDEEVIGIAFE